MKLKSETRQTIEFLRKRFDVSEQEKTVLARCEELNLNFDMVQRGLILLHKAQIIARDSRGPKSKYVYPPIIRMGDIVQVIEGVKLDDDYLEADIIELLNTVKL